MDGIPPSDKEVLAREEILRGRVDEIIMIINEINRDTPDVPLVFACSRGPGHIAHGKVGDPISRLGLLGILEAVMANPLADQIIASQAPRVVPAGGPLQFPPRG